MTGATNHFLGSLWPDCDRLQTDSRSRNGEQVKFWHVHKIRPSATRAEPAWRFLATKLSSAQLTPRASSAPGVTTDWLITDSWQQIDRRNYHRFNDNVMKEPWKNRKYSNKSKVHIIITHMLIILTPRLGISRDLLIANGSFELLVAGHTKWTECLFTKSSNWI